MTLASELKGDAHAVGAAFKSVFTGFEGELETFFKEGATAIANTIKTQLPAATKEDVAFVLQAALSAIALAETTPGGGQAKMTVALASFVATLATKGIKLVETQMRALIETTLLNSGLAKTAASTAGAASA